MQTKHEQKSYHSVKKKKKQLRLNSLIRNKQINEFYERMDVLKLPDENVEFSLSGYQNHCQVYKTAAFILTQFSCILVLYI